MTWKTAATSFLLSAAMCGQALAWGQDVHGYSIDNQLVQGRKPYTVSLNAQYAKRYFATLSYTNWVDNAPYDLLKDHDFLSFAIGMNL